VRRNGLTVAAAGATAVMMIALSPMIVLIPTLENRFPHLFDRLFPLSYIGMPGMLIARVFGDVWNRMTLPTAILGSWIFYFGLFFALSWLFRAIRRKGELR
jgi:hypothetical protein